MFFDVPVARQVVGFIYFTFFPGFVIIKLLKMDEIDGWETLIFSVGISVAFLMLVGLILNEFYLLLRVANPLSLMPLMIIFNSFILFGGIILSLRKENVKIMRVKTLELFPLVLFLILPILSVLGAMWVNVYENNLILIFTILAIALLFSLVAISNKFLPPKLYPLAVFMISISLLYHSSLISNYLVSFGSDNPVELFIFKVTKNNKNWSSQESGRLNPLLSLTILPVIYSILLKISPTWVFKLIYPLIFSFGSVALYQLWRKNMKKKWAFISTFFFMSMNTYYTELLGLNRQMIAELFFILLLLLFFTKIKSSKKSILFFLFSFALITSHYALAEIFLFFISTVFFFLTIKKFPNKNITFTMIILYFVLMFFWYIYTANSDIFTSMVSFGRYVIDQLDQFLDPASRGESVLRGLGLVASPTIWNTFSRVFAYLTEFFIVVGFIALVTKRINVHFNREFFMLIIVAMAFLAALIVVPGLANTLNMSRFYHILLFFLAPLCVVGAEFLVKLVDKRRTVLGASIVMLTVLVPYFLFQTGFVYEFTGVQSWSLPLSKHRMDNSFLHNLGYFDESEVISSMWISTNVDVEKSKTYGDAPSYFGVLAGYGMVIGNKGIISNVTKLSSNDNVYLNRVNVVEDIIIGSGLWNTTDIKHIFGFVSKIYSNSGCELYKNTNG